jgi:hypothetical protein
VNSRFLLSFKEVSASSFEIRVLCVVCGFSYVTVSFYLLLVCWLTNHGCWLSLALIGDGERKLWAANTNNLITINSTCNPNCLLLFIAITTTSIDHPHPHTTHHSSQNKPFLPFCSRYFPASVTSLSVQEYPFKIGDLESFVILVRNNTHRSRSIPWIHRL